MIGNYATLRLRGGRRLGNNLYVDLAEDGGGTLVGCRAYIDRPAIALVVAGIASIPSSIENYGIFEAALGVSVGVALWSVLIVGAIYQTRKHPAELRRRVAEALEATPLTPLPPPPEP